MVFWQRANFFATNRRLLSASSTVCRRLLGAPSHSSGLFLHPRLRLRSSLRVRSIARHSRPLGSCRSYHTHANFNVVPGSVQTLLHPPFNTLPRYPPLPPHSRLHRKQLCSGEPRLCWLSLASTDCVQTDFKSSLNCPLSLLVAFLAITVALWTTSSSQTTFHPVLVADTDHAVGDAMSLHVDSPGHLGNLTSEQEEKLRQLWIAVAKVCGFTDPDMDGTAITGYFPPPPAADDVDSSQRKKFGFFRWKSNDAAGELKDAVDDNDKYGQTKQFHKALASQSPEDIRQTIWSMVKLDHPDAVMLRFLRARKWDVDKALIMLVSAMHWRHSIMNVDSDIMKNGEAGAVRDEKGGNPAAKKLATDFMAQSRMGKSFLHGKDRQGRPISVIRVRLHKPGAQSAESLERYTVFIIETARLTLEPPVETATIIFDMTGFSLANMDYHPIKFMIQCFEANYPESLGAILVHNAPWVFQGIWKIIRGWLDPVVAAKVHFTNYRAGLEEFIEPSQLIKELDGDENWDYHYDEPVEGENDIMNDVATRDRLLDARTSLYRDFEDATRVWVKSPDSEKGRKAKLQRESIAAKLRADYWKIDPYLRSRSLYDRQGDILPGGGVDWYREENETVSHGGNNGLIAPISLRVNGV